MSDSDGLMYTEIWPLRGQAELLAFGYGSEV